MGKAYLAVSLGLSRGLSEGDFEGALGLILLGALLDLHRAAWEALLEMVSIQKGVLQAGRAILQAWARSTTQGNTEVRWPLAGRFAIQVWSPPALCAMSTFLLGKLDAIVPPQCSKCRCIAQMLHTFVHYPDT